MAKKARSDGLVYSTGPIKTHTESSNEADSSPDAGKSKIAVLRMERKGRGGKTVTIVELRDVVPKMAKETGKMLKTKCGSGGTVKENLVEIQGEHRDTIRNILQQNDWQVKG